MRNSFEPPYAIITQVSCLKECRRDLALLGSRNNAIDYGMNVFVCCCMCTVRACYRQMLHVYRPCHDYK